jgi:hypothetical protein
MSAMTTGSVPFIGTSGVVTQDNAHLFWDDTNNTLGIGTNSPGSTYVATLVQTSASKSAIKLQATDAAGYAGIDGYDSGGVQRLGFGYANSGTGNSIAGLCFMYIPAAGDDWVMSDAATNFFRWYTGTNAVAYEMTNGGSAAVGGANKGKLIYTTTGQKFQISANGAAYVDLVTSAAAVGVSGTMPKWTGANALGLSSVTDDGTTCASATNKFTVTEASGNTAIAGTLGVTGLATLTAGFTLGADASANSHKITNLTNGSSAQDAAAFGQIATAIAAATITFVGASVHNNGSTQSTSNNTDTLLTFSTEQYDTSSIHSTASLTSRLVAPVTGTYQITYGCQWDANATGLRQMVVQKNGSGSTGAGTLVAAVRYPSTAADGLIMNHSLVIQLTAGDHVELFAKQTSTTSLNVQTNSYTPFQMTLLGT